MIKVFAFSPKLSGSFDRASRSTEGADVEVSDPRPFFSANNLAIETLDLQENRIFLTTPLARSLIAKEYFIEDSAGTLVRLRWTNDGSNFSELCRQEMIYLNVNQTRSLIDKTDFLSTQGRPNSPLESLLLAFLKLSLARGQCLLVHSQMSTQIYE